MLSSPLQFISGSNMKLTKATGSLINIIFLAICVRPCQSSGFQLTIVHLNDFHARFEETSNASTACKGDTEHCIGGFSRVYAAINRLAKERSNAIILNAGDNFQGTLWYNIYKWNVTQHFLNLLPFDVYTLGNHEFDDNIQGVVPFLKAVNAPFVVANIDDSQEPDIQGLYQKSVVIERNGKRIGVIGVISQDTPNLAPTGKLRFLVESASVNQEAERLIAAENVDTIIVLSHCGYEADKIIAQRAAPKIGVIVGGHSHSFLYTGEAFPGLERPVGPYPTVVNHEDGRKILLVQASALSKFVGNITVDYNAEGGIISWSGSPIYLNNSVLQDDEINRQIQLWKKSLDIQGNRIAGYTNVLLRQEDCSYTECTLGNFVADAMVYTHINTKDEGAWTNASIAIMHSGGMRTSIYPGNVTLSDLILTLPFGNTFDVAEIQGRHLRGAFEHSAGKHYRWGASQTSLLQVSGIRVVYNISKPSGTRVQSLKVRCRKCVVPTYEDLEMEAYYRIAINSYLVEGGYGHVILKQNVINRKIGALDVAALENYLQHFSPVVQELQNRITIIQ